MKNWLIAGLIAASTSAWSASPPVGVGSQGNANMETPRSGQSMDKVRESFGDPRDVKPAVGEPPITRWTYAGFTVYFEHDRVIHAVKHK